MCLCMYTSVLLCAWRNYAFTHMDSTISLLFDPFEKTDGDSGEKKNCLISSTETGRKLLNCKNKQKKNFFVNSLLTIMPKDNLFSFLKKEFLPLLCQI